MAPQERSHNVIEVAADAPLRRPGGYFAAPAQPDPDDQLIIPPELEEEVKEMMKQRPPAPPPSPAARLKKSTGLLGRLLPMPAGAINSSTAPATELVSRPTKNPSSWREMT